MDTFYYYLSSRSLLDIIVHVAGCLLMFGLLSFAAYNRNAHYSKRQILNNIFFVVGSAVMYFTIQLCISIFSPEITKEEYQNVEILISQLNDVNFYSPEAKSNLKKVIGVVNKDNRINTFEYELIKEARDRVLKLSAVTKLQK